HAGACPSDRLDDLLDRPVEEPVVVGPETDADLLVDEQRHGFTFPLPSRSSARPRYSAMSVTTPAPTVRPPSRIANRNSFSIAIGVMSSTCTATLSPGITISVPAANVTTPVTSVVRK